MRRRVLDGGVFVEEEAHVGDDDVIGPGEQFAGGMISVFSWSEGIEAADSAQQSALFGQLLVHEGGERSQNNQPGPLDEIHCCD